MRTMLRKYWWALPLLLAAQMVVAANTTPRDPEKYFFNQTLGDLTEELATARSQGKQGILIFFEQEECPFCHRMKQTVLNQPEVQDYFQQHFLVFPVDIESTVEITDPKGKVTTQKDFFIDVTNNRGATPVLAFFDLDGNLVVRYTGATSGVEEFMWLGEYASKGVYKDEPFARYKRERRKQARTP